MLEIRNLHVNYGNFEALHGISLTVNAGEIVALLGGNGAGKSTTINAVSGLADVRGGEIVFDEVAITNLPAHERVRLGIVQVPEGRKLFQSMSVYDNLLIGSFLPGTRLKRAETIEMCFSVFPKLAERRNQLAGLLSGGEQQMCAISRALMSQPKLLMLDEPSLGLAPVIVDMILDTIVRINSMGVTIMLVEQNVAASLDIANRGYVIEVGSNVLSGTSAEILANENTRKAYLGI